MDDGYQAARRLAGWELGDASWADRIIWAYLHPAEANAQIAEEERDLHVAYLGSAVFADTRWEQGGIDAAESIARTIRAAVLGDALKGGK